MIALYIVGSILLLLTVLSFLRAELRIVYQERLSWSLRIGTITVPIPSKKPKKAKKVPKKKKSADVLMLLRSLSRDLFGRFFRSLRVKFSKIHIAVATGNAAATALLYSAVCAAVAELASLLDAASALEAPEKTDVQITADFLSEELTADIDLVFSLRLYQIVILGIKFLRSYLKQR